ncbi:MAG: replicative DNA helicase [Flavobacteriales bacterium]|nr:replicative DNA helicase [Flavobacteriales bacterium]
MLNGIQPPNAVEFEKLVLGTCLIDQKGLEHVEKIISDNVEVFYDPRHKEIYRAIFWLKSNNSQVDMMTVIQQLKKTNELSNAGGDHYIIDLTMGVSSSAHIEYHCRIVWEKYIKRKIIESGNQMVQRAYREDVDVFELLDFTSTEINKVHDYLSGQKPVKTFFDVHQEFIEDIKVKMVAGVPIPFRLLQEQNQGWQNSDFIIIAARPAMGKTALALEVGKFAAKQNYPVHFFSLEMANIQLHKRLISNELGISSDSIRKKKFTDEDLQKIFGSSNTEHLKFYYDDSIFQLEEIKSRARLVAAEHKTKLIIIDYLQLITTKNKKSPIYERVSEVSRELKLLAKELNLPIIALSQLNRSVESRPGKKPQLSDLRESGAIEQDADLIIFPYRPEYYKIKTWDIESNVETTTAGKALLITAKNRHAGESAIVVRWNPEYQKFSDLEDDQYDETPY